MVLGVEIAQFQCRKIHQDVKRNKITLSTLQQVLGTVPLQCLALQDYERFHLCEVGLENVS